MRLTAQQEFFARLVAEGKSQSEAYRQAYPKAQKWKPGNVWRRSSELSAKPDVLGRIEAIRAELRERTLWSMEQGEFFELMKSLCRHIAETYWPHLTPEQVQEMAESFVEEGA